MFKSLHDFEHMKFNVIFFVEINWEFTSHGYIRFFSRLEDIHFKTPATLIQLVNSDRRIFVFLIIIIFFYGNLAIRGRR
ncbi:hypothetical protein CQB05_00795 [Paracidovorax citrulli]|nr:hypothetical protein CQB05_00795 [Paracidovorax citrulli]